MILKHIELRNWTKHTCFVEDIPDKGIVLVTGPNGSGKSSIIEAVSVGAFGESLRGKMGWTDQPGQIILHIDDSLVIDRRRTGSSNKLQFAAGSTNVDKYDTATKAQEALDNHVGSHDIWRKSSVFSSQDPSNFSASTDAERKRLLEILLGLGRLDNALKLVRQDLKMQQDLAEASRNERRRLEERVSGINARIQDAHERIADLNKHRPVVPKGNKTKFKQQLGEARGQLDESAKDIQRNQRDLSKAELELEHAQERYNRLSNGHCSQCDQVVSADLISQAETAHMAAEAGLKEHKIVVTTRVSKLESVRVVLSKQISGCEAALRDFEMQERAVDQYEAQLNTAGKAALALETQLQDVLDLVDTERWNEDKATREVLLLTHVSKVLSTQGVRAHLLQSSLAFIEQTANQWLERIAGESLKLKLTPYTETTKGSARDVIGMEIEGAGGGHGYRGASDGERRRIDIALMLGLSEVTAAAHGLTPGTLYFDETFAGLDLDGVNAVCDVLDELSETRAVFLISHDEGITQGVRNVAMHIRLGGK
jgi:DNA repair exonuclease SbcCD ATPase subunit